MTVEEQAAMYEAGVKANLKTGHMGKVDWSSLYADALEDHMALERGVDDWKYLPILSLDWFGPEVTLQGYAAADVEWSMEIFKRWAKAKAKRLAAQRPLIHNGRKMRKNGN